MITYVRGPNQILIILKQINSNKSGKDQNQIN